MKANIKIKALLIACVITVGTLSLIQYYLVKNTYQLTRDKYQAEVRAAFGKINGTPTADSLDDQIAYNLKKAAILYMEKHWNKQGFFNAVSHMNDSVTKTANSYFNRMIAGNPTLKGVKYLSRYDMIVLTVNGREDTLLSESAKPYVYMGERTIPPNTLLISNSNTQSSDRKDIRKTGKIPYSLDYSLNVKKSHYIDLSVWKQAVFKRMYGVLVMAISLIIAVIVLFHLVFSAMLKQKKIAEIKTDFANNITHELKTPLSSVNLILKSLERPDVQDNPKVFNELLQSLSRQHAKIQHTVDTVLESAMLTSLNVELDETDITRYLRQYITDMMLASNPLDVNIEQGVQMLKINIPILDKALNSLVENAVKYSPVGSVIGFKSYRAEKHYQLEITDQGVGIAKDQQSQVFDKFYRVPEQNKHTVKGLGLGLFISKHAINQLGGNLTLLSEPGRGCTFIIKLPVYEN